MFNALFPTIAGTFETYKDSKDPEIIKGLESIIKIRDEKLRIIRNHLNAFALSHCDGLGLRPSDTQSPPNTELPPATD